MNGTLTTDTHIVEFSTHCDCIDEEGNAIYCDGMCYEDSMYYWTDVVLPEWLDAHDANERTNVLIEGSGMGWQRLNGYAECEAKDILDSLTLRGDYRIVFALSGAVLTAKRYSHDEPMGCSFVINIAPEEEGV